MSPVELRTHRSVLWGYHDPKMRTSYVYEFSKGDSLTPGENGQDYTFKEKKIIQMEEYGPVVPILRCHLSRRVLNLSYAGDIYETELYWEKDPKTRELMAKLGPGPGPRDAPRMRLLVRDAANNQPIPEASVQTSKLIAMLLPLPPRNLKADTNGQCEVNLAAKEQPALALSIAAPGYVTQQIEWTHGDIPSEWTAKLLKGAAVGGVVRDPAGKPISGVSVTLTTIQRNSAGEFAELEAGTVMTDAAGRWTNRSAPPVFKTLTLDLRHPDFCPAQYNAGASESLVPGEISKADLLGLQAVMVMKPVPSNLDQVPQP